MVITENSLAPAWDLDDFLVPGEGKVIFDGVTSVNYEYYEETAVFILDPGQKLVVLKEGTCIGGGDGGVEPNIGLIAPGGEIKNDSYGTWMYGFHFVNEVGRFRYADIYGQLVIPNTCSNLDDCMISNYAPAAEDRPPSIHFGVVGGYTDMLEEYEDFN